MGKCLFAAADIMVLVETHCYLIQLQFWYVILYHILCDHHQDVFIDDQLLFKQNYYYFNMDVR